jgi:predicted ATPase/DNA-binding XRE family transcriptional regulator
MTGANSTFGEWLRKLRRARDLTQEELADRIGCSWETIRKMESGSRRPSKQMVELLADSLKLSPEDRTLFAQYARAEPGVVPSAPPAPAAATGHIPPSPLPVATNLVPPLTPLIGREQIVSEARSYLMRPDVRLLTLSGPPGIGKTRVGLQVAADLLGRFSDGVFLVALAPVSSPELVVSAIAQTLGVREAGGGSLLGRLKEHLRDRQMLLVLDNFEQVIAAAPLVSELMSAAQLLRVLVTSRQVLRLSAEHEFPVPPLEVPDTRRLPPVDHLAEIEAVRLFIERARTVKSGFALGSDNAPAVAEICYRLDGLPLAIELAAARVKLFSPQAMLGQLKSMLKLLTSGARDLPARQQTLRGAIDWSYNLLDEEEQALFRRMSVFVAGSTLEAAEAVIGPIGIDILDGVASLVDKSLLQQQEQADGETRFGMLGTLREYAAELLAERGEAEGLRGQHARYYMRLAEQVEPRLRGSEQKAWLDDLETEHDNLRAALLWTFGEARDGSAQVETGLRLAGALWRFWFAHGHLSEGRGWLEGGLAQSEVVAAPVRAKALYGSGRLAVMQGDYASARARYEQALEIYRELGDRQGIANSLNDLGNVHGLQGDYATRRSLQEQSLALFREVDDRSGIAGALFQLANVASVEGDHVAAASLFNESLEMLRELGDKRGIAMSLASLGNEGEALGDHDAAWSYYQEGLQIFRELGDRWSIANSLVNLGNVACNRGDYPAARALLEESLGLFRELGAKRGIAYALAGLGNAARSEGDYRQAASLLKESLAIRMDLGNKQGIAECLEGLARVAGAQEQYEPAATLLGAAQTQRAAIHIPLPPAEAVDHDAILAQARERLGAKACDGALAAGQAMSLEQAIAYAMGLYMDSFDNK